MSGRTTRRRFLQDAGFAALAESGDKAAPVARQPLRSARQGLNHVLRTTHRQNFLVPPRARRSFPLVELL